MDSDDGGLDESTEAQEELRSEVEGAAAGELNPADAASQYMEERNVEGAELAQSFFQERPNRPIEVLLASFTGMEGTALRPGDSYNLKTICDALNKNQNTVHYIHHPFPVPLNYAQVVETPDDRRYYPIEMFMNPLATLHEAIEHCPPIIGITDLALPRNSFNRHDIEKRLGVVTVDEYENFVPLGMSVQNYLQYLILCETLCILTGVDIEHRARHQCLFDMCDNRKDLRSCLAKGYIHEDCMITLTHRGVSADELHQISAKLDQIKHVSVAGRLNTILREQPVLSLLLSAEISSLFAYALVAAQDPNSTALAVLIAFIAATVILLIWRVIHNDPGA